MNGVNRDVPDGLTVKGLIIHLNLRSELVAVELNREIAKRAKWDDLSLRDGDCLEIVSFVGGG